MDFELVTKGKVVSFYLEKYAEDAAGIAQVAYALRSDIKEISGQSMYMHKEYTRDSQVVACTIGKSQKLEELVSENLVSLQPLEGKKEAFMITTVPAPEGTKLLVVGTKTVATLHGIYHISEKMGVSPWIYWADVKPEKREEILLKDVEFVSKEPSVTYRGFFMNDEWPALGNYVMRTFGDFNEFFYEKVFDLLLRLKGNYFWPAMWSASLPIDGSRDPQAILRLATSLGITIGQSHHEPLTRASEEWDKVKTDENNKGYGKDWNYYTNRDGLYRYWKDGMARDREFNHMITIGMRGERDTMMLGEDSSIQENVDLLKEIITDQKEIIRDTGCEHMPQMLALYKEVEDFYYGGNGVHGLKDWDALDDTILLLSDDNFGNLRTLPTKEMKDRKAGWGLYYHFDYHGGPISYEWINSTTLPKVWEQLTQAYESGIQTLWIVNVGDLKPQELPLSYYMDLAYDYERYGIDHPNETDAYLEQWVRQQFCPILEDPKTLDEIRDCLKEYTRILALRKPEAMNPGVFHPTHERECERMITRCKNLSDKAKALAGKIPDALNDVFFQLVYFPCVAGMNVLLMSLYAALNHLYAEKNLVAANRYGKLTEEAIALDQELTRQYHEDLSQGKWNGMMLSAHVWFVTWNEEGWHYPEVTYVTPEKEGTVYLLVEDPDEGADAFQAQGEVLMKETVVLNQPRKRPITLANSGEKEISVTLRTEGEFLLDGRSEKTVSVGEEEVTIILEYPKPEGPEEEGMGQVNIYTKDQEITLQAPYRREKSKGSGVFLEEGGVISMECAHATENTPDQGYQYQELKEYGKTLSSNKVYPVGRSFQEGGPSLTYRVFVKHPGEYSIQVITAPDNPYKAGENMTYAIAVGDEAPQNVETVDLDHYGLGGGGYGPQTWAQGVLDQCHYGISKHTLNEGLNDITIQAREEGLTLQKIVCYQGSLPTSYLGPEESQRA